MEDLIQDVSTDRARRDAVFGSTVASIKRNLLSPPRIALPGGRYVRPVDVTAEILKKIKRDAEEGHFHEPIPRAVITCPAEFNVLQRQKIEEAGRLAGFSEVALLEEPVAGALAYAHAGLDVGEHVLVYDLGGGTFDLAVLDNEDDSFHVAMEPKGMERCGGDDFDLALYHHCDEVARRSLGRPISLTAGVDLSFLRACRRRKESLTFQERGRFDYHLASENGPAHFEHEVDRQTFEELIGEYVETSARLTTEILEQADDAGHEVDTVVLVGGSVRIPLVNQRLTETLPVIPLGFDKRDVAVALGAARYTNVLWGERLAPKRARASAPATAEPPRMEHYRSAVAEVRGKKLNRVETGRLEAFAEQLGVSAEEAEEIELQSLGGLKGDLLLRQYREAVATVWSDGRLDGLESAWLEALAEDLGLEPEQTSIAEREVMGNAKETVLSRQSSATAPPSIRGDFSLVHALSGHNGEVHSVAFSPDGLFLVSGASEHTIMGWNARSGQAVGALSGHTGRVSCVAFSPDGRLLASGGFDKTVRLWKLPNGEPFHGLTHPDWVFSVAVAPDSRLLASGGADATIRLWSLGGGELLRTLTGHSHWVLSVAIASGASGGLIASGGADGTARIWDLDTAEALHTFESPDRVRSVALAPEDRLLAAGCEDGALRVWSLEDSQALHELAGHSGAALCVAFSHDGRLLFSGGSDGRIKVWDARTGEPLSVIPAHTRGVSSIAAGPEGLLASGGHDHEVKVWGKASGPAERSARPPRSERFRPPTLPD